MDFAALATSLDANVDKSAKRPKFTCLCPVDNCSGTLTAKDFGDTVDGDSKPALICSAGCLPDLVWSAITLSQARLHASNIRRDREAGEHPPSPAVPHLNGNGKVHEPPSKDREPQTELDRVFLLRSWKRLIAKTARLLLDNDDEYKKPVLTLELILPILTSDLVRLVKDIPENRAPKFLSETDVTDELDAIARWAIGDFLSKRQKKADAEFDGEEEEPEPLKPLGLGALYDLVDEFDRQPWVWDGILPQSSLSLIVGKSETGKSTMIYRLIAAIIRGEKFLDRQCQQGRVLYLAGDPISEIVAGKTLKQLGLTEHDGVQVVPGALVGQKNGMAYLKKWVSELRPVLVIADTLAATVAIDVDKYGQSYQIQQPLTRLARDFKPNFLMSHHSQKSAIDTYSVIDSALGSVGVAAVASTRMGTKLYQRQGKKFYTFAMSNSRIGQGLEGEWIVNLCEDGRIELDGLWGKRTVAMDQELILNVLKRQSEPIAERTLWGEIFPKPKWQPFKQALIALIENQTVVSKTRHKRGGGRVYFLKGSDADVQGTLHEAN